jgi:hypothetical protein
MEGLNGDCMPLLSQLEQGRYALATGHHFYAGCDNPYCGKLIPVTDLYVELKGGKIRCIACNTESHPVKTEVKVAGGGRGAKKLSPEDAAKLSINGDVRKAIISILKRIDKPLSTPILLSMLKRRKAIRQLKKTEITATLRGLKKVKVIKYREKTWLLVAKPTGSGVKAKKKKKKVSKVLAKRG